MTKTELLRKIRAKCLDCCCDSPKEVTLCAVKDCVLYDVRLGKDPTKRVMSDEKRLELGDRLKQARAKNKSTQVCKENPG